MEVNVTIKYFAVLKESAACDHENIKIVKNTTAENLFEHLRTKYCFPLHLKDVRVAINDEFSTLETQLHDGDIVAFIPPVSGG